MNKLERARLSGVQKESENVNLKFIDSLYAVSYIVSKLRPIDVEGSLPKQGPAILVANHISNLDALILGFIAWRDVHRHVRVVAKHTLFDTSSKETEEVIKRIGRESFPDNAPILLRRAVAYVTQSLDAIPVNRGAMINRTFAREAHTTIENQALLGIFINEIREPNLDLTMAESGAAALAKHFPAIPIVPIGISGTEEKNVIFTRNPLKVAIGKAFTYQEVKNQAGEITDDQMTQIICERIAHLVNEKYKYHWMQQHGKI